MLKHTTYDEFHKEAIVQKKVISDKNFTYRNILGILKKELTEEKLKILDLKLTRRRHDRLLSSSSWTQHYWYRHLS